MASNIEIKRTTDIKDAPAINNVLFEAFNPYSAQYSEGAMNATIVSTQDMEKRLASQDYEVLIALYNNEIAGTASIIMEGEKNLYLCSMAVKPDYHGKGIGYRLLEEVEKIGLRKGCITISLETSVPLVNAKNLYEKFGFKVTGNERDYYGVTIFEMVKSIL